MDEPLATSINGLSFFLRLSHPGSKLPQMDRGIEQGNCISNCGMILF